MVSSKPPETFSAGTNLGSANASLAEFDLVRTMAGRDGGTISGSPLTADPLLGPLQENSGPTQCGGRGKDSLRGGRGKDTLRGASGDDLLRGETGNDRLLGGAGGDRLLGGAGKDSLFGGAGRDKLRGGPGTDLLRGGPGRDSERQ